MISAIAMTLFRTDSHWVRRVVTIGPWAGLDAAGTMAPVAPAGAGGAAGVWARQDCATATAARMTAPNFKDRVFMDSSWLRVGWRFKCPVSWQPCRAADGGLGTHHRGAPLRLSQSEDNRNDDRHSCRQIYPRKARRTRKVKG